MPDHFEFDYDVFISYSSQDKQWVRKDLLKRIEEAGLRAFIDFRDFRRGAPSIKEMERGVTTCRKTLLVLTPEYIKSGWCEIENIMLSTLDPANRSLRLIPLLKAQCEKPLRISALTHIDYTDDADLDLAWHQLLDSLEALKKVPAEESIPSEIQGELDRAKALTDADKFNEAMPILEKALTAADAYSNMVAKVKVRSSLAHALYEVREDALKAEQYYREALAMVPADNLDLKHGVLNGLGQMLIVSGRLDEAKATLHAALEAAKLTGKTYNLAVSLCSLSLIDRALGFHDIAITKLDEAVHLLLQRELSLPEGKEKKENGRILALCYINKALLCQDSGNLDEAMALYRKAEELHRISDEKQNAGQALLFRGEVHCMNAEWEEGFNCFRRALEFFSEAANPLWGARALENVSRLLATHERWEEALNAMLGAAGAARESGHPGEQVHFLCLAAKLLREWKTKVMRDNLAGLIHSISKETPADQQNEVMQTLSTKVDEMHETIEKAVREDEDVLHLLNQAKEIAQKENLPKHLANCLLDEAHNIVPPADTAARQILITTAVELLKEELRAAQFPKKRAHLMGRISALYRELGERTEALSWLKKAGDIYEKFGDVYGLANYYESLAEMHHVERRHEIEIATYRKVLSMIEGRSFHRFAAGTRINLAAALRFSREFAEAQKLLNEAEAICKQHHFKDYISAIARNRSDITDELQIAQAPGLTLSQLLGSLHQLLRYHPEHSAAYLQFWYFAWKTELLALLRSGTNLSFMVVTDNVDRFQSFATKFKLLADHFLLATPQEFSVKVEKKEVLPIPPTWRFPATFPFLFVVKSEGSEEDTEGAEQKNDKVPSFRFVGPATKSPPYMMVDMKSDVKGEGHIMALTDSWLPKAAIELMIHTPVKDLIKHHVVWCPMDRFSSKDPFLSDLGIGHERGFFPVYFDRLPTSDEAEVCGSIRISIPNKLFDSDNFPTAAKWRRALLKLTKLPKDAAQTALLDLPDLFADSNDDKGIDSTQVEIHLFEFNDIDHRAFHPAILVKGK